MTFWFLVLVMLGGGLAAVLPALLRDSKRRPWHRVAEDLYRQRIEELQADIADGVILPGDEKAASEEIERALLADTSQPAVEAQAAPGIERTLGIGLAAVLIPAIALSVYLTVGVPELARVSPTANRAAEQTAPGHASFEELVKNLEQRLADEPDNAEGWQMLARTYLTMQDYPKAVAAIERVYRIVGEQPEVMLQYAETLAMANGGSLQGRPAALIEHALTLEPDNVSGLWLAGFSEDEKGNLEAALKHWRRAQTLAADNSRVVSDLQSVIDRALARNATDPTAGGAAAAAAGPASTATGAGSGRTDAPADPSSRSELRVSVRLSDDLKSRVSDNDTVFVFARSLKGPPMPLAVARRSARELPFEVTLDDSMAMTPNHSLSSVDEVRLVARVSKSGTALPQSGDLEGEVVPIKVGTQETIAIRITSVVE